MLLPTNIATGRVTGQFLAGVVDGVDGDQDPDAVPAQGFVTFTASVPYLPDPTASPNPVTVLSTSIVAVLDNEGYLCTPVQGTLEPSYRGVRLIATDDPDLSVSGWTWNATYSFSTVSGQKLAIPTHSFAVPSGGTVDLTTVVRVPSSTGIGTEQAEALAASAQAAAVSAAQDAATAAQAAVDAADAAQVTDADISALVANPASDTAAEIISLLADAAADKLNVDDAINTYQSQAALDAAAAAKVGSSGTSLNNAVKAVADTSAATAAAPKLDSADAATTYAAKSVETSKLDASQKGAASGVATLDSGTKVPLAQVPDILKTDAGVKPVGKGELFKNVRGYKLPADTDDLPAITAAQAANPVVFYPDGNYNPGAWNNAYSTTLYTNAAGPRWQGGRRFAPSADPRPVMWVQKHSGVTRDANAGEWDNGAGYFAVTKEAGAAPVAALTGFGLHLNDADPSGIGGVIGIHARARGERALSNTLGLWVYSESRYFNATSGLFEPVQEHNGMELNLNNQAPDQGWRAGAGSGSSRGLILVTQDGSNPVTHMLYIGKGTNAPLGKIHTGMLINGDAISPSGANSSTQVNDNEAIRIEGASSQANQYTGIRFRSGTLATGISFKETAFSNNCAILFGDDQRIVVGPGPSSSSYLGLNKTTSTANFANLAIAMNGTKVLGSRETGWGAVTGTVDKTAWTTYTAPTISAAPTQAEVQAVANAAQANSRKLAAIQQAITTHGLIGA